MIGADRNDNYTSVIPKTSPNYVKSCRLTALSGLRLGIPRNAIALEADETSVPQIQAFSKALHILRSAGAVIVDNANFTAADEFWESDVPQRVLEADFIVNIQGYLDKLATNPNQIKNLAQLRNFTQAFPLEEYHLRDTDIWDSSLKGCEYYDFTLSAPNPGLAEIE